MGVHWLAGIVTLILGLVVTFFGYRLLRFTLVVLGFGLGLYLGWLVGMRLGAVRWLVMVIGIGLGIVGALVSVWLFKVSVFLLGAVAGALIVLVIFGGAGLHRLLMVLLGALVGGVMALLVQKPALSLLTAFTGAWGVVAGFFTISGKTRARIFPGVEMPILAVLWLVLGGIGFLVQMVKTGGEKKKKGSG